MRFYLSTACLAYWLGGIFLADAEGQGVKRFAQVNGGFPKVVKAMRACIKEARILHRIAASTPTGLSRSPDVRHEFEAHDILRIMEREPDIARDGFAEDPELVELVASSLDGMPDHCYPALRAELAQWAARA